MIDLKVTLVDGAHHEVDSSPLAFETAARTALREALRDGHSVLLEPSSSPACFKAELWRKCSRCQ